ncbi:MAG: TolB family protein, partial [Terriglobia bacterium]
GKAIFTRWRNRGNTGPRSIVARDLGSGREKELYRAASPARVAHLGVSPDGQRLAFVWWDPKEGTTAVKVISTSGGEARELLKLPAAQLSGYGQPVFALAWTPDSRHIIYAPSTAGQKHRFELWRISADGGEPQNLGLAMEGLSLYGLSVHPDGRRIAFTAGTPRRSEVWVLENFLPPLKDGN